MADVASDSIFAHVTTTVLQLVIVLFPCCHPLTLNRGGNTNVRLTPDACTYGTLAPPPNFADVDDVSYICLFRKSEQIVFQACHHPFVLQMDYAFQTEQYAIIVLNLITTGNLQAREVLTLSSERVRAGFALTTDFERFVSLVSMSVLEDPERTPQSKDEAVQLYRLSKLKLLGVLRRHSRQHGA